MKEGWTYKKLGEVCEVVSGSTPKTNVPEYWGKGHYWVTPAEINDSTLYVNKTERQITDLALQATNLRLMPVGTVLLSSRAPIGKVAITNTEMYCNQGFKNCICSNVIYNKYLFYYLRYKKDYLNSLGRGATFKEISKSIVEQVVIPLPSFSKQQSIVSELDMINELISLKKAQMLDFDSLAQSIFYEMFGDPITNEKRWEVKKLGEVIATSSGGTPSKSNKEYYEGGTIPWLRSGEVSQGFIYDTELFITEEGINNSSAKLFPKDTVVVAMYGATVGQVGIIKKEMTTNQAICGLFPNELFTPVFLYFFMRNMKPFYLKAAAGGAQSNISQGIIKNTLIPLPPLPVQQHFSDRIEAIEHQKLIVNKSLQEIERFLQSRLDYWFND